MEKISENKKIIKRLFLLTLVCLFVLTTVNVVQCATCPAGQVNPHKGCMNRNGVFTCEDLPVCGPNTCSGNSCSSCTCSMCEHSTYTCKNYKMPCPCPTACRSSTCVAPSSGQCPSGSKDCSPSCDPSSSVCCKASAEYCQPLTGNKIKDLAECSGNSCAYQITTTCGKCTNGKCSISGCSCDSSCNIPVPGCSSSSTYCTALAPDTCGYALSSCHLCSEGYECGSEGGSVGCYPCDCGDPTSVCGSGLLKNGKVCSGYGEVCYGSVAIDANNRQCCMGTCSVPSTSSCGTDCFCTSSCSGPVLYSTGKSCTDSSGNSGKCCCLPALGSTCGNGECEPEYGETTSTCPEDCGGGPSCSCTLWTTSDNNCDNSHCSDSCEKYYTRNCNPDKCRIEEKCEAPAYSNCVYDNECSTTGSQSNACPGCTNTCTRTVSLPYTSGNNEKIGGEEIYCSDTLDNDCDSLIDYDDPDCSYGINGTVTNASSEPIKGARIKILGLSLSDITDENGNYFIKDVPNGAYDIVASKTDFSSVSKNFNFDATAGVITIDFVLYTAGSDCKPDCSKTTDPEMPVCHMDCEGINGCHFYDDTLMNICTRKGEMIGVPVGNTVSYNETYKARCCKGIPYLYEKIPGTSLVFPETDTLVRITRIVFFRGQFARMIIDVWE